MACDKMNPFGAGEITAVACSEMNPFCAGVGVTAVACGRMNVLE